MYLLYYIMHSLQYMYNISISIVQVLVLFIYWLCQTSGVYVDDDNDDNNNNNRKKIKKQILLSLSFSLIYSKIHIHSMQVLSNQTIKKTAKTTIIFFRILKIFKFMYPYINLSISLSMNEWMNRWIAIQSFAYIYNRRHEI